MSLTPTSSTGGSGAGQQLDYVEITAAVTITATADGNNGATAVINGNAVAYSGTTRVVIEVYAPELTITPGAAASRSIYLNLYDGTTDLGRLAQVRADVSALVGGGPVLVRRFLTPSAGSHTYNVRGWKDTAGDTASVQCGAGGASTLVPAYVRVVTV